MEEKEFNFDNLDEFSIIDDFDSSSEEDYGHEIVIYQSIKESM